MFNTHRRLPRTVGVGLLAMPAGWVLAGIPGHTTDGVGLIAAGVVLAGWPLWRRLRPGSRAAIARHDRHTSRHAGTASRWDVFRSSSGWAMRRRAAVLRPSLRGLSWWRRLRVPLLTYATPLCRTGGQTVWTSGEESTLRVGIPGTGKTAELACRVIDAPGGAVVTSTAADLYELTAPLRARRGPVTVFNPAGLGGLASTLRWSPLTGCVDPAVATRRAADLMGPAGEPGSEGERWAVQGRRVLAVFLHAAALGKYQMRDVAAWVANPDPARTNVLSALADSPQAFEMRRAAEQAIGMNPRTRDGVMLAIAPALAWVTLPAAAAIGDPDPVPMYVVDEDDPAADGFDVADLTDRAGSLYLLGGDDGTVAPLVAALVAEIAHQARATAATRPGGRLDPGLSFCLDEIALVCPTPLDRWMAELRKRSIVIHAACQGLGQLRQRWGDNGAGMILNSAAAVLVFGGCKDAADLALFTDLAGHRDEEVHTRDATGQVTSTTTRRVPVIAPAMLAGLRNHRAMLIRRGMPVALARTPIAWKRRDVRRIATAAAKVIRAAEKAAARGAKHDADREPVHASPTRTGARP
jgi:type IV secretion system protein VirD4